MNIQDISRLHEHYARPAIVIEMPAELSGPTSMPLLPGTAGETGVSPVLQRIKGSWRSIGLCLCLIVAAGFGGSFLGSLNKEPAKRESGTPTQLTPEARMDAPTPADHEASTPAALASASVAAAPASVVLPAAIPAAAAPVSHVQLPTSEPTRPIPPRPVIAVQAPAVKAPPKIEPPPAKPAPSTKPASDVKMF